MMCGCVDVTAAAVVGVRGRSTGRLRAEARRAGGRCAGLVGAGGLQGERGDGDEVLRATRQALPGQ